MNKVVSDTTFPFKQNAHITERFSLGTIQPFMRRNLILMSGKFTETFML